MTNMRRMSVNLLHIVVIGAAGCPPDSEGQLPLADNIIQFASMNPDKVPYFYFMDPRHWDVPNDIKTFQTYNEIGVAYCVITKNFRFDDFSTLFKIGKNDEVLFVDYANITSSEAEFITRFGERPSWNYLRPGCMGSRLDLICDYKQAQRVSHYTIHSDMPVPQYLSKEHREDLIKEISQLMGYIRYLPTDSKGLDPPQWLRNQIGDDRELWKEMYESAREVIVHFFEQNNMTTYNKFQIQNWDKLLKEIVMSA